MRFNMWQLISLWQFSYQPVPSTKAWCNLQVKLCDPCLSALCVLYMALYKTLYILSHCVLSCATDCFTVCLSLPFVNVLTINEYYYTTAHWSAYLHTHGVCDARVQMGFLTWFRIDKQSDTYSTDGHCLLLGCVGSSASCSSSSIRLLKTLSNATYTKQDRRIELKYNAIQ